MIENKNIVLKNEAVNMRYIAPVFFIRSKTNDGEFAKQYFHTITGDNTEPSLVIDKLVLSDNFSLYQSYKLLKIYKGKGLFEVAFGIKLTTLFGAVSYLSKKL